MKHELKTKYRTCGVTITEMADRIVIALSFSKFGKYPDIDEWRAWYTGLIVKYDADPRPIQLTNPHSGQVATIFGDANSGFGVIEPRSDIH